jgi:hypothetical protein
LSPFFCEYEGNVIKMRIATMSDDDKALLERNLIRGNGKIITVHYQNVVQEGEGQPATLVDAIEEFYIGKIGPGQSGNLLAVLAALLIDGVNAQEVFKRRDALIFLELLNDTYISMVLRIITGMDIKWIKENWDLGWVIDVLEAFFEYNDFFVLMERVQRVALKFGLTAEKAKGLMLPTAPV